MDQTQVLPTYGVLYVYNHYYIILRMHKKTRKIQFNDIADKAEHNKLINSVCLDGDFLVH